MKKSRNSGTVFEEYMFEELFHVLIFQPVKFLELDVNYLIKSTTHIN